MDGPCTREVAPRAEKARDMDILSVGSSVRIYIFHLTRPLQVMPEGMSAYRARAGKATAV